MITPTAVPTILQNMHSIHVIMRKYVSVNENAL